MIVPLRPVLPVVLSRGRYVSVWIYQLEVSPSGLYHARYAARLRHANELRWNILIEEPRAGCPAVPHRFFLSTTMISAPTAAGETRLDLGNQLLSTIVRSHYTRTVDFMANRSTLIRLIS